MDEKWTMFDGTNYPDDFGVYSVLVVNHFRRGGRPLVYSAYYDELFGKEELGRMFYTVDAGWGDYLFFAPEEVIAWHPLPSFDELDWKTTTAKYWEKWDAFDKKWKELANGKVE